LVPEAHGQQAAAPGSQAPTEDRIVTPAEVKDELHSTARIPLRVISYPHRFITREMEKGLTAAERKHLRERLRLWQERMRELGIQPLFGGLGEQTGFGGGLSYKIGGSGWQNVTFLGRATFANYQEFDVRWTAASPVADLTVAASYQSRPRENFYGLGQDSLESQRTNFALRQSWIGAAMKVTPSRHLRIGAEHKWVVTKTSSGRNPLFVSTEQVFPDLPGFGSAIRQFSSGAYADIEFAKGEFDWGGRAHFGGSYQHGAGDSNLRFFSYEGQLEGRMPVRSGQSGFVGLATLSLTRERSGSDPIPFYMRPRIGGSSTLRGFQLDRFYGRNLMMLTLEYRYRLHPNLETSIFHDAGQIFDRAGELNWFNWHRNYGISVRFHSNYRTIVRLEYGYGDEGFTFHLAFGDSTPQPLGGVVRYGTYRR
jgi:hypothetical protein